MPFFDTFEEVEICSTCGLPADANGCECWWHKLPCGCTVNLLDEESVCWCGSTPDSDIPPIWKIKQERAEAKRFR